MANSPAVDYGRLDELQWDNIPDLDLLATMFSLTLDEKTARQRAEALLQSSGSLGRVVQRTPTELRDLVPSSGKTIAFINLLRLGIHRVVNERTFNQTHINSHEAMAAYIAVHRNPAKAGNRRIILLDRDSRLLRDLSLPLSRSNLATCCEIVQEALRADAFGLIVLEYSYNKEGFFTQCSKHLFGKIKTTVENFDIEMHDYYIIGTNNIYSMSEQSALSI